MKPIVKPRLKGAWILLMGLLLAGCASTPPAPKTSGGTGVVSSFPGMRLLPGGIGWFFQGGAYRTRDSGAHWQDLTPADLGDSHFFTGFALDARHAWLVTSVPGEGMRVYRTVDGGGSWSSIPLIDKTGPAAIQFSDARHGNILLGLNAGMNREAVALFRTADGGKTWTEVAGTRPGYFRGPLLIGPLNDLCCVGAVTFRNGSEGWITGAYRAIPKIYLQHTTDGGQRWLDQVLPLKPDEADAFSNVAAPVFPGNDQGFLAIGFTWSDAGQQARTRVVVFHSGDGGGSWQRVAALDRRDTGAFRRPLISFVDASHGWLRWGSVLYRTRDGGRHWTPVTLNLVDPWSSLQFIDRKTGWVESLHAILTTHDGGSTWQPLKMP